MRDAEDYEAASLRGGPTSKGPKWFKEESTSYPGNFYYRNEATGDVTWDQPPDGGWQRCESSRYPGTFYMLNDVTDESYWL